MKLSRSCFLILMLTLPTAAQQAHQEEIVRNTYAKVALLASLGVLTDWYGKPNVSGNRDDLSVLNGNMLAGTPVYTFSDFKVGPVSEIANEKWLSFITQEGGPVTQILEGQSNGYGYVQNQHTETEYGTSWNSLRLRWTHGRQALRPEAQKWLESLTVAQALELQSLNPPGTSTAPLTFTQYASYTVSATLKGRASGPHNAILLFGADAKQRPVVISMDAVTGGGLSEMLYQPLFYYDPTGLLLSPVRDTPAIRDWLTANVMPAESCSATATHDYCCSNGQCGISSIDFNQAMATFVPKKVAP